MARTSPSIDKPTLDYTAHTGPNRVAAGRLDPSGIPGLVFAPVSGRDLPVVTVGHGWLQPVSRYSGLMRHLASWGFIVVAPATERGPVPSHSGLGEDLSRALQAVVGGRVAGGVISGSGDKLGVLGHSVGGGAAVLAAAADTAIKAVVTVTPVATKPALAAAGRVRVPALHLVGQADQLSDQAGADFARSWGGPVQLREVKDATHLGLGEGKHWTTALTGDGDEKRIHQVTCTLATAFLLRHLAGQEQLADDLDKKLSGTGIIDLADPLDES